MSQPEADRCEVCDAALAMTPTAIGARAMRLAEGRGPRCLPCGQALGQFMKQKRHALRVARAEQHLAASVVRNTDRRRNWRDMMVELLSDLRLENRRHEAEVAAIAERMQSLIERAERAGAEGTK
jgi:hypothetical protein